MAATLFPDGVRAFAAAAQFELAAANTGSASATWSYGAAAPSAVQPAGSIYSRTNGSLYVNTDGTGTGWQLVSSVGGSGATLLAAATAASTAIANTTAATRYSTTYTIPANSLAVGDVLRVTGWGTFARAAAETLALALSFGGTALAAPAAINAAGDLRFEATFTVRALGAAGVGAISSVGHAQIGTASAVDSDVEAAAIDTTVANVLGIEATMSAAATGTTTTLQGFVVEKLRA